MLKAKRRIIIIKPNKNQGIALLSFVLDDYMIWIRLLAYTLTPLQRNNIMTSWVTCGLRLMKIHSLTIVWPLSFSQCHFPLWPWPVTSKINTIRSLVMAMLWWSTKRFVLYHVHNISLWSTYARTDRRMWVTRSGSVLTGLIPPRQPIQVFGKVGQSKGQGHSVRNIGINRKVLSQGIDMCSIKALSLLVKQELSEDNDARRAATIIK